MSYERYEGLVRELSALLQVQDVDDVLTRGWVTVQDFEILLNNYETDPDAMYMGFNFGQILAGRATRVYRLMLEANLTVYAQDQAQLGMDADTGFAQLIVRIPMSDDIDGPWLVQTIEHYCEHGRYWKDTIAGSSDDMFSGVCAGNYHWIRA